jgi:hypothetical protein
VVLESLLARHSDPRRLRSLAILDTVCRAQKEHSSGDYSIKTIGRLSSKLGGPGAPAIANPAGAAYRELISAHHRANTQATDVRAATPNEDAVLLNSVRSPVHRARIRTALADAQRCAEEARQWRVKANALQSVVNATSSLTLASGTGDELPTARPGRQVSLELLPMERAALASALDPRRLASVGLRVDPRGRVMDAAGKAILPIGFALMLAKVAQAVGVLPVGDGGVGDVTEVSL